MTCTRKHKIGYIIIVINCILISYLEEQVGVGFTDYVTQLTYLLFLKKGDSSHRTVY